MSGRPQRFSDYQSQVSNASPLMVVNNTLKYSRYSFYILLITFLTFIIGSIYIYIRGLPVRLKS